MSPYQPLYKMYVGVMQHPNYTTFHNNYYYNNAETTIWAASYRTTAGAYLGGGGALDARSSTPSNQSTII